MFVNSVSDLFHRDVPWGFVDQVFGVMEAAEHQTFLAVKPLYPLVIHQPSLPLQQDGESPGYLHRR